MATDTVITPATETPSAPVDANTTIYGKDGAPPPKAAPAAAKDVKADPAKPAVVVPDPKPTEPAAVAKPSEKKAEPVVEPPKVDEKKPDEKTAEAKEGEVKDAKAPEPIELKLPKDSVLKPDQVEKLKVFATENKLTQEKAQELLQSQSDLVGESIKAVQAQQKQLFESKRGEWLEASKKDKEFGGENLARNAELAHRALTRFGSDALKKELSDTGFGNHPEILRVFVRIGKAMEDASFIRGNTTSKREVARHDLLYPGHKE